jgi:hypothetical protein
VSPFAVVFLLFPLLLPLPVPFFLSCLDQASEAKVVIFDLSKFSGKCNDLFLFLCFGIPVVHLGDHLILVESECHECFGLHVSTIVIIVSFLLDVMNELMVTCVLISLEQVDHEVIAAFAACLETFPVHFDICVELLDVSLDGGHVSIQVG